MLYPVTNRPLILAKARLCISLTEHNLGTDMRESLERRTSACKSGLAGGTCGCGQVAHARHGSGEDSRALEDTQKRATTTQSEAKTGPSPAFTLLG